MKKICLLLLVFALIVQAVAAEFFQNGIYTAKYISAIVTYQAELDVDELLSIPGTSINHYDFYSEENAVIVPDDSV
ncbi:MAG: hypothetical protein HN368_22060, partial [Spirochaetales bacterium]|nr:hypothetical protein [Spirochaetales bacterium]